VQLIGGAVNSPVKMPYVPNSMVLDRTGTNLYFGSSTELMVYTTGSIPSLTKQDPNVPGMVLAAAPDNSTIVINDPIRKVIYLYKTSGSTFTTQNGVATSAQWTPDSKTVYVVGSDASGAPTLFVNNVNTGWTTYPLGFASSDLAITVPSVGAFLSGTTTVAHAWCPSTIGTGGIDQAYPEMASVPVQTDILGATIDGAHMLGASVSTGSPVLTDINLDFSHSLNAGACPSNSSGGTFTSTKITTSPVTATPQVPVTTADTGVPVGTFDQVLPSPASNLAFLTFSASGNSAATAKLPYYTPATGTPGVMNHVTLSGSPKAPVAGVFSLDDTLFFVSTSGDNLVHYIDLTKSPYVDSQQINPGLVDVNNNPVPATVIVVKPRATT
jgi:hypothetical protein